MIKEIRLTHEVARNTAINFINQLPVDSEHPLIIVIDEEKRTLAQNRMMWAVLNDIAKQVEWNGEKLTAEEWKHLITANLHGQKCVKGIQGGLVFMGLSTRKMKKKNLLMWLSVQSNLAPKMVLHLVLMRRRQYN